MNSLPTEQEIVVRALSEHFKKTTPKIHVPEELPKEMEGILRRINARHAAFMRGIVTNITIAVNRHFLNTPNELDVKEAIQNYFKDAAQLAAIAESINKADGNDRDMFNGWMPSKDWPEFRLTENFVLVQLDKDLRVKSVYNPDSWDNHNLSEEDLLVDGGVIEPVMINDFILQIKHNLENETSMISIETTPSNPEQSNIKHVYYNPDAIYTIIIQLLLAYYMEYHIRGEIDNLDQLIAGISSSLKESNEAKTANDEHK